jgi:hypothetical protein
VIITTVHDIAEVLCNSNIFFKYGFLFILVRALVLLGLNTLQLPLTLEPKLLHFDFIPTVLIVYQLQLVLKVRPVDILISFLDNVLRDFKEGKLLEVVQSGALVAVGDVN